MAKISQFFVEMRRRHVFRVTGIYVVAAWVILQVIDLAFESFGVPATAMRFVWYAGWIARRFEDPVFPDAFPHFGSEEYWEREAQDLEEQLERIRRGAQVPTAGGAAGSAEGEGGELTNEDFFWDL